MWIFAYIHILLETFLKACRFFRFKNFIFQLTFAVFVKSCCPVQLRRSSCQMLSGYLVCFPQGLVEDSWTETSIVMKNLRLRRCTVVRMAKYKWTEKNNNAKPFWSFTLYVTYLKVFYGFYKHSHTHPQTHPHPSKHIHFSP